MKLLLAAIAGVDIGYGHVSRCISLADCARRHGIDSEFLIFGDPGILQRIESLGYSGTVRPVADMARITEEDIRNLADAVDAGVADVAHPIVFDNIDSANNLLDALRRLTETLVVIDTLGKQTLARRLPDMPADIVVVPYVGATTQQGASWRTLAGPKYAVLAPAYADLPPRAVRDHPDRLLLSCGGSDPRGLTSIVLNGIEQIPAVLTVRVVIGPLFTPAQMHVLAARVSESHHIIELLNAPEGLAEHMLWSDLAIAASGLIKYELAASSTPAVLMSIDSAHDEANRSFVEMGGARDLGVDFDAGMVAKVAAELLGNREALAMMAESGRRLVDGQGADRLIDNLMGVCCGSK